MFDYIKCEYPLPSLKEAEELNINLKDVCFQTKDFENLMDEYVIKDDGKLYHIEKKYKWADDDGSFLKGYMEEIDSKEVRIKHHGVIRFYHFETDLEKDGKYYSFCVDFDVKFNDGNLVSLDVAKIEVEDVTTYKFERDAYFEKIKILRNKWYNKYFWNTKIVLFVRKKICRFFYNLHTFTGNLYSSVSKTF